MPVDIFAEQTPPTGPVDILATTQTGPVDIFAKPSGSPDDEIIKKFGFDPAVIKKSRYYSPGMYEKALTDPQGFMASTFGKRPEGSAMGYEPMLEAAGGLMKGVVSGGQGMAQAVTRAGRAVGLASDADVQLKDLNKQVADYDFKTNWQGGGETGTATKAGELAGGSVTTPVPPAWKGANFVSRAAAAGLQAAGGQVFTPTDVTPGGPSWAEQKASQVPMAALMGGLANPTLEVVAAGAGKAYNALAPRVRALIDWYKNKPSLPGPSTANMRPGAAEIVQAGEVAQNPYPASMVRTLEKKPPEVVTKAGERSKEILGQFEAQTSATPFKGIDEITKVAQGGGPRAAEANKILEEVAKGGPAEKLVQTSQGLKALQESLRMDANYAKRDALAAGVKVDPVGTVNKINEFISELTGPDASKWPNGDKILKEITNLRDNLINTSKEVPIGLFGPSGEALSRTVEKPNTFISMRHTMSDVSDKLTEYFKGANAEIGEKGSRYLTTIKKELAADTSRAAQSSGVKGLAAADTHATNEYSKYAGTYRDKDIVAALQSKDFKTLLDSRINNGQGKFQDLYNSLDPKGQAALAEALIKDSFSKAFDPKTKAFNAGNVAKGIEENLNALGITLTKKQMAEVKSAQTMFQHLAKANPKDMSAMEAASHIPGKAGGLVSAYSFVRDKGIDWMFNTKAGKELLFASRNLPPGGQAMENLIAAQMPRIIAQENK